MEWVDINFIDIYFEGKQWTFKIIVCILQLTSQHPYAEEFIGEPHVFTVDIHNEQELRRVLQAALKAHNMSKVCGDRKTLIADVCLPKVNSSAVLASTIKDVFGFRY